MNKTQSSWRNAILCRFGEREDIGKEGLYENFFKEENLPQDLVLECLGLIESEYGLPVGILRPADNLAKLFEPVETRNPFRWLEYQVKAGDKQSEISYQLEKKFREYNTVDSWQRIETIGELIRAWCGQKPN